MKTKLIAGLLLAGSCLFAAPHVSFGIGVNVGAPVAVAPAPVYVAPPTPAPAYLTPAYVPPAPGPGFVWVPGYYVGRVWHAGYWTAPHREHFEYREHFRR